MFIIDTDLGPSVSYLNGSGRGHSLVEANKRGQITCWDFDPGSLSLPLIIAHRGDASNAPENTLPAFKSALSLGADGVELDVRLTKDQQLVVFHDHCLGRTASGSKPVNHYTGQEIRGLDVGSWFALDFKGERAPTLDEVFESLPKDFLINVEMKTVIKGMRLIATKVAEVVRRHERWDSTLAASFNPISLWELRKIEPRIFRGYIWSRRHPFPIRSRSFSPLVKPNWYDPAHDSYSPRLHRKFHARGARILAWDLDFDQDLEQIAAARVDGIITDSLQDMLNQKTILQSANS